MGEKLSENWNLTEWQDTAKFIPPKLCKKSHKLNRDHILNVWARGFLNLSVHACVSHTKIKCSYSVFAVFLPSSTSKVFYVTERGVKAEIAGVKQAQEQKQIMQRYGLQ